MSKNIFKTEATTKNSSNKGGNNNRFSSLKDELNEKPVENSVIPKREKIVKEKSRFNFDDDQVNAFTSVDNNIIEKKEEFVKDSPKSRFNFDDDEVNVFTVINTEDSTQDTRDTRDTRIQNIRHSYNSFTTLKPPVIKPVEVIPFVYNEELFPELILKKNNSAIPEKISFADKLKLKQTEDKKEEIVKKEEDKKEEIEKPTLVEKLKSRYKEDIEENKRKQEEKRIQEEKDYVKPGWVYFKRDPITKKMTTHYGDDTRIIVREKTLNEHMNYWVDGVVDRYLRRKEMLENVYGINDDYSPPEENNIEYFDMLDEKAEQEKLKENQEIINKYFNENEEDDYAEDSYSNDYWKKR